MLSFVKSALPSARLAAGGSVLWALSMGMSAFASSRLRAWGEQDHVLSVTALLSAGCILAFVPAVTLANLATAKKGFSQRMAAHFVFLALATIGFSAAVFTVHIRAYYALWHDEWLTPDWLREQFFTTASAFYQFAVLGIRLYLPFGLIALTGASFWLAKKPV